MRARAWRRYYWLDVRKLSVGLLKPNQTLVRVKYYTSPVFSTPSDPDKARRQATYLEALKTLPDLEITFGKYQQKLVNCFNCGATWQVPEEKMTDVNIAVGLMRDAFEDKFDTALLISGDSDLSGPVRTVRGLFSKKRVVVVFPPERRSAELAQRAHANFQIGRAKLAQSQFPDEVTSASGFVLKRPPSWS